MQTSIVRTPVKVIAAVARTLRCFPHASVKLFYVTGGLTIREMATAMKIRPKTAENYRARLLVKIGVRNAVVAVHFAVVHGLLVRRTGGLTSRMVVMGYSAHA